MRRDVIKHGCATRGDHTIKVAFAKRRVRCSEDDQIDQMAGNLLTCLRRRRQPGLRNRADIPYQKSQRLVAMDDPREHVTWARVARFPFSLSSTDLKNREPLPCPSSPRGVSLELDRLIPCEAGFTLPMSDTEGAAERDN